MLYTVTFNPSLDYLIWLEQLQPGEVNRASREAIYPGGKGINVSILSQRLGQPSTALGFLAGFTGEQISSALNAHGCRSAFIRLEKGMSRINVKLHAGEETEINGQGPFLTATELRLLTEKLEVLHTGDALVLAGSVPAPLPESTYGELLQAVSGRGILTAVDASGGLLRAALPHRPWLIKPNLEELSGIFGIRLSAENVLPYLDRLQAMGARNILLSMAGEGALLLTEQGELWRADAPHGTVVNSVGAGDSMLAGFLTAALAGKGTAEALRLGIACGSATAFTEWLAEKPQIDALFYAEPSIVTHKIEK